MTQAVFQSVGPLELLIVLAIVLVIFGPRRLPQLGRQLGGGMREFKDSIMGRSKDADEDAAQVRPAASDAPLRGGPNGGSPRS